MHWEDDFTNVSKAFPNAIIKVDTDGEEGDDLYTTFFNQGKHYSRHRVVTYEFDPDQINIQLEEDKQNF